jgi:hypothetical protein
LGAFDFKKAWRARTLAGAIFVFLVVCYVALFAAQERICLADYPDWVYQGYLLHLKVLGGGDLPQYALKPYPVPNSFCQITIAALCLFFDPILASKLLICAYIIAFAHVLLKVCATATPDQRHGKALILLPVTIFATPFWWGSLNYQCALVFFLHYLCLDWSGNLRRGRLIVLSLLIFFSHAIVFQVFLAHFLVKRVILERKRGQALLLAPSLLLTAWHLISRFLVHGNRETLGQLPVEFSATPLYIAFYKLHMLLKRGPLQNFILPGGSNFLSGHEMLFWLLFVLNAAFVIFLAAEILRHLRRLRSAQEGKFDAIFFLLLAAAFLVTPIRLLGVADYDQRLLILAFMGLTIPCIFSRRSLLALSAVALIISAYTFAFLAAAAAPANMSNREQPPTSQLSNRLLDVPVFARTSYYDNIDRQEFDQWIFPSGMLFQRDAGGD